MLDLHCWLGAAPTQWAGFGNGSWWAPEPGADGQPPAATLPWMRKIFLPTSRKVLPTFQTFCLDGVQIAQTVVNFAHFQVQVGKRGVLGWAWGCFMYVHIPERGV